MFFFNLPALKYSGDNICKNKLRLENFVFITDMILIFLNNKNER